MKTDAASTMNVHVSKKCFFEHFDISDHFAKMCAVRTIFLSVLYYVRKCLKMFNLVLHPDMHFYTWFSFTYRRVQCRG